MVEWSVAIALARVRFSVTAFFIFLIFSKTIVSWGLLISTLQKLMENKFDFYIKKCLNSFFHFFLQINFFLLFNTNFNVKKKCFVHKNKYFLIDWLLMKYVKCYFSNKDHSLSLILVTISLVMNSNCSEFGLLMKGSLNKVPLWS